MMRARHNTPRPRRGALLPWGLVLLLSACSSPGVPAQPSPSPAEPAPQPEASTEPEEATPPAAEAPAEAQPANADPGIGIGQRAPAFELTSSLGGQASLESLLAEDQLLALVFFRSADW